MSKTARRVPRHPMQRNTRASYHRVNRGTTSSATSCHGLPQSHVPTKASSSSIHRTGVARLGTKCSRPTSRMKSLPGRSRSPVCGGRLDLRPFCKPIHPAAACATEPWIPATYGQGGSPPGLAQARIRRRLREPERVPGNASAFCRVREARRPRQQTATTGQTPQAYRRACVSTPLPCAPSRASRRCFEAGSPWCLAPQRSRRNSVRRRSMSATTWRRLSCRTSMKVNGVRVLVLQPLVQRDHTA